MGWLTTIFSKGTVRAFKGDRAGHAKRLPDAERRQQSDDKPVRGERPSGSEPETENRVAESRKE